MKVDAVIQARMSSRRLPGKVLMQISKKSVLELVIDRVKQCNNVNRIVVATSTDKTDNIIEEWCKNTDTLCTRGSLNDVLNRYLMTARRMNIRYVLRITADCPVIDPDIIDRVIDGFFEDDYDMYGLDGEFPDGLDCTIFKTKALEIADKEATLPSEREHVGPYIQNNEKFKKGCLALKELEGKGNHRWTLDEKNDYTLIKKIYEELGSKNFRTKDIIDLMKMKPELKEINANIIRNEGYLKSLERDKVGGNS